MLARRDEHAREAEPRGAVPGVALEVTAKRQRGAESDSPARSARSASASIVSLVHSTSNRAPDSQHLDDVSVQEIAGRGR